MLLESKVAGLTDVFMAKLGWLKGNIYSRVATPDIEENIDNVAEYKRQFFEKHVERSKYLWLSGLQKEMFDARVKRAVPSDGISLSDSEVNAIINELPTEIEILSDKIVERLVNTSILDVEDTELIEKARSAIRNVPALKQLINQST